MDHRRLRTGELIAAVGGAALLIIMFLFDWFGIGGAAGDAIEQAEELGFATPDIDTGANAWDSMEIIRFLLLITGLVAVGLGIATAMARDVRMPVASSALVAGLGILSVIFIAYRILDPPYEAGREIGVFLGLIAAAAVAYGGWRSMQEEGTSFGQQADALQDRHGGGDDAPPPPPPPPPPTQPPPATGGPPAR
jgi:hypothetical protein